ncbi:MAG: nuclear transport factor 2 family protein, partial [Cyanobacteria bacterium J06626_14]
DGYLNPAVITLDLLSAGGLFKVGVAPAEVGDRWISAVVVRDDGITALTRRLQVVPPGEVSDTP